MLLRWLPGYLCGKGYELTLSFTDIMVVAKRKSTKDEHDEVPSTASPSSRTAITMLSKQGAEVCQ